MMRIPTATVEADLAALRTSAERAGTALACLFSTSAEFEAAVIRTRTRGLRPPISRARRARRFVGSLAALVALTFVFLML